MGMKSCKSRNSVQVYGAGEKVLMLAHGFGTDQQVWHRLVPELKKNYTVITFDYTGAGLSDAAAYDEKRYSTINGYAQDIVEILDEMKIKKIHYIGHSVSGMIGAEAAMKRPDLFASLIMIGPSAHYLNDGSYHGGFEQNEINALMEMMERNYKEWAKTLAAAAMGRESEDEQTADFEHRLTRNDALITRQFAQVTFQLDYRDYIKHVDVPVTILQAQEDVIAPVEAGRYIHEQIEGSRFVLLEAKGHNPHLINPEEITTQVHEHVEAVEEV
ncbi:alpha/beta fold hydrolase [Alkalicoccus halolimnae]|uniref:Alpha/beta hydrolase n=1 Tax=Alkalicoccus halolimnae TaxID=1667239 RepID=A0A5C7FIF5_9BACI|nr:alpha/beta hydrolase [Alkalicoccus halolimnae]TXF86074.1 alpha/beta hydrolase [Alkalicoccus halolimnae]